MQDISDCLSPEAQNVAEARLAAKRAARAEAREIRMKELERQQKEVEERSDKDFAEKGGRPVSSLSAATLASLGGTSSRRGSGDTSISVDTEASIREIKDSLAEVEEKYKRSMVTNAQLDNEKTSLQYQVDTLREVLQELEEELAESRRQYDDKQKECERQKHEQSVLRFQLAEMKEALEQRETLLTEIRQLQQKQELSDREICDLKETIEWKDKKIGALERQKEFFDPVRSERDALREEVAHLREALKKNGIALDSDNSMNGDTSVEHHVNSDGPPDPPVRAVSMGNAEGALETKTTMSVVGECPPSETGQDKQEIAYNAEGGDVLSEHNAEEINSNTILEMEPVDVCGHEKSEICMDEPKEEMSCDITEDKHVMSETELVENILKVDGETTLKQNDISPSGSEVFQDAIDYVDETPSTIREFDEDIADCVDSCEKEELKNNQSEEITKSDDQCTMGRAPYEGAETLGQNTVNICDNDESKVLEGKQDGNKANSSNEDISTTSSESITVNNLALVPIEEDIKPPQSLQQESGSQTIEENKGLNEINELLSLAESVEIDQSKIISVPEHPSTDTMLTNQDLVVQIENDKTSEMLESCVVTERKCIMEDEPTEDHVIPEDNGSQNEQKHVPEDERPGDVSVGSEDLKVVDQKIDDTLSPGITCDDIQKADDAMVNIAESPKEIIPPDIFSSEGESTQDGEETDDDDDNLTIRSEKYTGESEIPYASLGSSVDRQSMEDIRMEDASDKSPKKGKGKNKEDCVVS